MTARRDSCSAPYHAMSRLLFNSPSVYRQRHVQSPSRMQIGEGINDGCTTRQQLKLAGPAWGERFHARVGGSKPRKVDLSQTLRYKPSAASFLPVRIFGFVFVKRFHHKSHVTGPHTAGSIDFPLSASPTEFQHHLCDGKAMRKRGRLVRLPSSSRDTNTGATQAETGTSRRSGATEIGRGKICTCIVVPRAKPTVPNTCSLVHGWKLLSQAPPACLGRYLQSRLSFIKRA